MGKKKKQGKQQNRKKDVKKENLEQGLSTVLGHPLFGWVIRRCRIYRRNEKYPGKGNAAIVSKYGEIFLNDECLLTSGQWAYVIAHCVLHLAFGHFDREKIPVFCAGEDEKVQGALTGDDKRYLWNMACDIYIAKFLSDIKFGCPVCPAPEEICTGNLTDEPAIYTRLIEKYENKMTVNENDRKAGVKNNYGVAGSGMDMRGLEAPLVYDKEKGERNRFAAFFAFALSQAVTDTVRTAGGCEEYEGMTEAKKAAQWFAVHYPLLGGLASSFKIIEDYNTCMELEVQVAAVDAEAGEIYINPAARLWEEELKFVLAHEFLHAGLDHHARREGRDTYLWNIACDYVVNGWLAEMEIGQMPEIGLLYDEKLKDKSAEEIYDLILGDMRRYQKLNTFRGYGKGDILSGAAPSFRRKGASGMPMDEFCKSALAQGLEYHRGSGRGVIPAGLIEEIQALAMPPVPWDVKLARWFEEQFPYQDNKRTYARPSRRQGVTPDIPRPGYIKDERLSEGKTFGVVVDTSGSMSAKMIGMALGSIASYAAAREVELVRVVFCDAFACDAGYLSLEEIAGQVEVKGRGGTRLQPGADLLEGAKDFPKEGPILLITDGQIESRMIIHRKHAFLIPEGKRLPFHPRGEVFYFS